MASEERQIVVFADTRPTLAALVHNRLTEAGIESFLDNEFLGQAGGDLPAGAIVPRVIVAASDAEDAHEVIAEFQREAFGALTVISRAEAEEDSHGIQARPDDESETSSERIIAVCPACGKSRMTICPYCSTASSTFRAGDRGGQAAENDSSQLVICQTCDEPFEPIYYRRCAWCGHDFGSGRETEPPDTVDYLNDRATVAVVGLGVVLLVILAYFSTLLK